MVQIVPHEAIPEEVQRYLLPSERRIITVRRHPVVLFPAAFTVASDGAALVLTSVGVIPQRAETLIILCALLPLSCCLFYQRLRAWMKAYVVITNARIMLINLKWRQPLIVIPLAEAYNMTFARLTPLRPFSLHTLYGSFIIGKHYKHGRVQKIRYLPYAEQLYLEICGLLFSEPDQSG